MTLWRFKDITVCGCSGIFNFQLQDVLSDLRSTRVNLVTLNGLLDPKTDYSLFKTIREVDLSTEKGVKSIEDIWDKERFLFLNKRVFLNNKVHPEWVVELEPVRYLTYTQEKAPSNFFLFYIQNNKLYFKQPNYWVMHLKSGQVVEFNYDKPYRCYFSDDYQEALDTLRSMASN